MNPKIAIWVKRLSDPNPTVKQQAIRTLEEIGEPEALYALADLFATDPDEALRVQAQQTGKELYYNLYRLQLAYYLIKQQAYNDARPIIEAILRFDPKDVDAWWLMAHAADGIPQKRAALMRVLQLKPDHAPARMMLDRLDRVGALEVTKSVIGKGERIERSRPRRKIKWLFVALVTFGILAMFFTTGVLLDNYTGSGIFSKLERQLFGDPPAKGWVNIQYGGLAREDIPREERIPITQEKNTGYGSMSFDVLDRDEAHRYNLEARHGDQIVAAATFTANGDAEVLALELWDSQGRVVAREYTDQGFSVGALGSGRVITYDVVQTGSFTIVVVSRAGGPSGNYTLMINTADNMMEQQNFGN